MEPFGDGLIQRCSGCCWFLATLSVLDSAGRLVVAAESEAISQKDSPSESSSLSDDEYKLDSAANDFGWRPLDDLASNITVNKTTAQQLWCPIIF